MAVNNGEDPPRQRHAGPREANPRSGRAGYPVIGPATSMGSRIVITVENETDTSE